MADATGDKSCLCLCLCLSAWVCVFVVVESNTPAVVCATVRLSSVCWFVSVCLKIFNTPKERVFPAFPPPHLSPFHPLFPVIPPSFPYSFLPSFQHCVCPLLVYLPALTHSFTAYSPLCLHLSSVYFQASISSLPFLLSTLPHFLSPLSINSLPTSPL